METESAKPNANGVHSSPTKDETTSGAEKTDLKDANMVKETTEKPESTHTDVVSISEPAENHSAATMNDVEKKEVKEKTPQPDTGAKSDDLKKEKPTQEKEKASDEKKPEDKPLEDVSGEERVECVIHKPLTSGESSPKKADTVEKVAAEEDKDGDDDEHEDEEDDAGEKDEEKGGKKKASPKKRRKKAPMTPRKKAKKAEPTPKKSTEKASPKEKEKDEEEETPVETSTSESPKKSAEKETPKKAASKSTEKREKTPTPAADVSPKSSDKTPLLEASLIVEGKRSRQRVDRLATQMLTPTIKDVDIPKGKGAKLGDIEFIDAMISKTNANELKPLHKLCFGRTGTTPAEIKKNLRSFCGINSSEESKEREKKKKSLEHVNVKDIKKFCEILGLDRSATRKEELVEVVLNFLAEPKDQGKKTPAPAAKRKRSAAGASSSRKRSSTGKSKTPKDTEKKGSKEEDVSDEDSGDDKEDEVEEKAEEKDEETEEEPKSKKGKKEKPSTSTPSSSKRGQPKRGAKKPAHPTDADIRATIKELLKGMNLEEVTMKEMTKKVYDKYPNVDITGKKDFIKSTVKTLLSNAD